MTDRDCNACGYPLDGPISESGGRAEHAGRVRCVELLRAELARVAGERDEARTLYMNMHETVKAARVLARDGEAMIALMDQAKAAEFAFAEANTLLKEAILNGRQQHALVERLMGQIVALAAEHDEGTDCPRKLRAAVEEILR